VLCIASTFHIAATMVDIDNARLFVSNIRNPPVYEELILLCIHNNA
jgi:hypothetical protein